MITPSLISLAFVAQSMAPLPPPTAVLPTLTPQAIELVLDEAPGRSCWGHCTKDYQACRHDCANGDCGLFSCEVRRTICAEACASN